MSIWILDGTISALSDERVKVSSNDSTEGYLNGKLVAGANVTLTENNDGGAETLTIATSSGSMTKPLKIVRGAKESSATSILTVGWPNISMAATGLSSAVWTMRVPTGWDATIDPKVFARGFTNGTNANNNYRFEWAMASKQDNETASATDDQTITFTEPAPTNNARFLSTASQSIDRTKLAVDDILRITFRRLGDDLADTRTGPFHLVQIWVEFARNDFGVST